MSDVILVATIVVFFAVAAFLVRGADHRLTRRAQTSHSSVDRAPRWCSEARADR
jgi:hypothetical protein